MDDSQKIQDRLKQQTTKNPQPAHNEQVIFICPGCNMSKDDDEQKGCCNCRAFCRKSVKRVKIFVLSGPGLTLLLLSYLMIGAVTFNLLEGGRRRGGGGGAGGGNLDLHDFNGSSKTSHQPYRDSRIKEAVERLWKITENLNVLYKDNWTKLASEEINNLQDDFFEELTMEKNHQHQHEQQHHQQLQESGATAAVVISECNTKNYQSNRKRNPPFWNLGECFLYSLSLLTTVGSGNILPRTIWGRVISIFYILVGFFIMLIYLAVIGDYLANPFRRVYAYFCHSPVQNPKPVLRCNVPNCEKNRYLYANESSSIIPVWLAAIVLIMYITGGAFIFNFIEKWTLLDSWYFCFLSLVTIGFGGFTPGRMENISMIATSVYILVGMALLSMCFNLVQTDVITFFRNLYVWSDREDMTLNLLPLGRIQSS